MSLQNDTEVTQNSGYGSADETASLIATSTTTNNNTIITTTATPFSQTKMASINGPTPPGSSSGTSKPVLMRQDRTSTYLASPNLSQTLGCSEESGPSNEDSEPRAASSIPDIDVSYRLETPVISISNVSHLSGGHRSSISGYQLTPHIRCRACRNCERRASTTPVSSSHLARSVSRESVRSSNTLHGHLQSCSINIQPHIPPVLVTASPTSGSRIIRQSSQPEASNIICCGAHTTCIHSQTAPSVSLRQLRDPGEGIAGIAADSLRINGAMRPFKQVNISPVLYVIRIGTLLCIGLCLYVHQKHLFHRFSFLHYVLYFCV